MDENTPPSQRFSIFSGTYTLTGSSSSSSWKSWHRIVAALDIFALIWTGIYLYPLYKAVVISPMGTIVLIGTVFGFLIVSFPIVFIVSLLFARKHKWFLFVPLVWFIIIFSVL